LGKPTETAVYKIETGAYQFFLNELELDDWVLLLSAFFLPSFSRLY
jgi:hypothetical protein